MVSAAFNNGHALGGDGYCYSWGRYSYGRLGTGGSSDVLTPKRVLGNRVCSYVSEGGICGIQLVAADGSSWAWGYNDYGQLGIGTTGQRTSPVSTLGNRSYAKVSSSYFQTIWIDGDGHMWASGYNDSAQLGIGNATNPIVSPMSVLGDIKFEHGSAGSGYIYALEEGGINLWAWGYNSYGQHGTGDTTARTSPVLVLTPPL